MADVGGQAVWRSGGGAVSTEHKVILETIRDALAAAIGPGGVSALSALRYAHIAPDVQFALIELSGYPSVVIVPGPTAAGRRFSGSGYEEAWSIDVWLVDDAMSYDGIKAYWNILQWEDDVRDLLEMNAEVTAIAGVRSIHYRGKGKVEFVQSPLTDDGFLAYGLPVSFEVIVANNEL